MNSKTDYLFEASWEVCNKVGGIYTVVKSKISAMQKNYKNYYMIGPYFPDKARGLDEKKPPKFLEKAFEELESNGIKCYFGTWDDDQGVILLDAKNINKATDDMKKWLWENYNVDSLHASWDFEEPMRWGWAVGMLMQKVNEQLGKKKTVLHCHEWLAGFALLYTNKYVPDIKTVFTTHATMLGRSIAGNGEPLYDMIEDIKPGDEAKRLGVMDKFSTEKACAHAANVFTTVSEITAIEAENILGKKPDVLLNNGMDVETYPTIEETTLMHVKNREVVREFLSYYFLPYYSVDLKHNMIYFIVGWYEFKNKGLDIMIDSLGKLNDKLKKLDDPRTVTVFIWVPMSHSGINKELLENQKYYNTIKNKLNKKKDELMKGILDDLISDKCSMDESIFTSPFVKEMKNELSNFHREGSPPLSTHNLIDHEDNSVIKALKNNGLDNKEENRVKVIVYPVYLDGNDGLLNLPYYDALSSGHLGIFPSYYEPWGYTPVESMSLGVPAVTTDLAGFGRFIAPKMLKENPGIFVLERFHKDYDKSMNELYKILLEFSMYDHAQRVQNKINAKNMSILTDWNHFVKNYIKAHNLALKS